MKDHEYGFVRPIKATSAIRFTGEKKSRLLCGVINISVAVRLVEEYRWVRCAG